MNPIKPLTAATLALLLAACGGGGSGDATSTSAQSDPGVVPASAMASPASYTHYVAAQAPNDEGEPLLANGSVPPESDDDDASAPAMVGALAVSSQ